MPQITFQRFLRHTAIDAAINVANVFNLQTVAIKSEPTNYGGETVRFRCVTGAGTEIEFDGFYMVEHLEDHEGELARIAGEIEAAEKIALKQKEEKAAFRVMSIQEALSVGDTIRQSLGAIVSRTSAMTPAEVVFKMKYNDSFEHHVTIPNKWPVTDGELAGYLVDAEKAYAESIPAAAAVPLPRLEGPELPPQEGRIETVVRPADVQS